MTGRGTILESWFGFENYSEALIGAHRWVDGGGNLRLEETRSVGVL
jgi:hypothetical protein